MFSGRYKIGVIVITYNGEAFIKSQLESILIQKKPADVVMIFDDCSSDRTVEVIKQFLSINKPSEWSLFERERNNGWTKNAIRALSACSTDYVLWSDQDDIWRSDKIEVISSFIDRFPNVTALYSSWTYIDEKGQNMGIRTGIHNGDYRIIDPEKANLDIPPMLGCASCFRKDMIGHLMKILPLSFDSPDWLLYRISLAAGRMIFIDQPLLYRRIHSSNVTASRKTLKPSWKFNYGKSLKSLNVKKIQLISLEKCIRYLTPISSDINVSFLVRESNHLNRRIQYIEGRSDVIVRYLCDLISDNDIIDFFRILLNDTFLRFYFQNRP